jgi:hypothetical protein
MSFDNTNTGVLFRNKRKEKDTQPDHTGSINVDGKEYWLSAWVREGKPGSKMDGAKFFSLALRPKDTTTAPTAETPATTDAAVPFNDEIPFAWTAAIPVGLLFALTSASQWVA